MRSRIIRLSLVMLAVAVFLTAAAVVSLRMAGFPGYLRFVPGREHVFEVPFPFSVVVKDDQAGILRSLANNGKIQKKGACTALLVGANRLGQANLELRLFGVFAVRQIVINVAEEARVVPCGHAIGVVLSSDGVLIVGHVPLRTADGRESHPARKAGLLPGDILVEINGRAVSKVEDVERLVTEEFEEGIPLRLLVRRQGKTIRKEITPVVANPVAGNRPRAMLGVYVQDAAAGVGTLTFYEPRTSCFAALGHLVNSPVPQVRLTPGEGKIVEANISGVEAGSRGEPGEKIGIFRPGNKVIGTVLKNCRYGLYGQFTHLPADLPNGEAIPIAPVSEVKTGPAEIWTVLQGSSVRRFQVQIEKVNHQNRPGDKGIVLAITDRELLARTGGIIQGMSGSPIIQNGKLVGAVTHVFVNDPRRGYGIFAEWMWYELMSTPRPKTPEQTSGVFLPVSA